MRRESRRKRREIIKEREIERSGKRLERQKALIIPLGLGIMYRTAV
jgi:tmRNA-binding protein